jgi:hypothetical protein
MAGETAVAVEDMGMTAFFATAPKVAGALMVLGPVNNF